MSGSLGKCAIVMPSIGVRPWVFGCAETFRRYCQVHGFEFFLETEWPSLEEFPLPELPNYPGRRHKRAYGAKTYFAWKYLHAGYDRVLIVDDTCVIRASTPSVFELVPFGSCGYTRTSSDHAKESFDFLTDFTERRGETPLCYDATLYMNSGFVVYDQSMLSALAPQKVIDAQELLFARFPHQTLTYYLLRRAAVPQAELSKAFNKMPALELDAESRKNLQDVRPFLRKSIYVYHISAFYLFREQLLEQIYHKFLDEWEKASPSSM